MVISLVINLGILAYFKYNDFFFTPIRNFLYQMRIIYIEPRFDILLPVGISFYTFQALGYTIDVYRDDIKAEKNFVQYALFISFFPQLVAGPIERSKNLLPQLSENRKFSYENFRHGFLLMLWGYFLKIVIADRAAIFVDTVYTDPVTFGGWYIVFAAVLFSIQIYCDFYGYSVIAKGAAQILGITLSENFKYPYLRRSISDFWKGWHISLTTWFRDYLYIPLGGNRKGRLMKYRNIMIVFLVSGLWHGASWAYVIWGGLHGLYQIIGEVLLPVRKKLRSILSIDSNSLGYKVLSVCFTFILTTFAFIFFRSGDLMTCSRVFKQLFSVNNSWVIYTGFLTECGLDTGNLILLTVCIEILLFADFCKMKKIVISDIILRQDVLVKSLVIALSVVFILLFGIWGPGYDAASFIYFQF